MFTRIVRNFAKIRVPQGFSGELKLYKGNWERITKGEPIAYIGNQTLRAESSGLIVSQLSQEGSLAIEGTQIYQFFDFTFWLKVALPIFLSPFVSLYIDHKNLPDKKKQSELKEEEIRIQGMKRELKELETKIKKREIELKDPQFSVQKIKETLNQPKPGPEVEGHLIENPELTRWWIEHLEEPIRRGVDVVYGPKGIGKSTFMERLCHVLSNPLKSTQTLRPSSFLCT